MRIRRTDQNGDMTFGRGQNNFWRDAPDGVALLAQDRLMMFQGEWFLDRTAGTPWNTRVLGKYTGPTRDMVVRSRVKGTSGCTAITAYDSQLNRDTRGFSVQITIDTAYGSGAVVQAPY